MIVKSQNKDISIIDFPRKVDEKSNVRVCDSVSEEEYIALLSQYLNVHETEISDSRRLEILNTIHDYVNNTGRKDRGNSNQCDIISEPEQISLFSDCFRFPYPNKHTDNFTFIDLFAGIGGIRLPFTELGYKCVFSSEWDKNAQKTYFANFGEMPFGDITNVSIQNHIPEHFDLLLAGFPCQAFSIIGKRRGFEDARGTLFFEVAKIIERHRPKAFLLENVKQLTTHDQGRTFKTILNILTDLGYEYKWKVLNALDFGLPQKRERVIIVGFRDNGLINRIDFNFPVKKYNLANILEDDKIVNKSLFASENILKKRTERTLGKRIFYPSVWHENKSGNISILDYACALRTGASYNYLLINGQRRPSSRELLRFQGFPDNFKIAVSHSEIRRQTGNSVAVPMIREIAKKIDTILKEYYYETSKT